MSGFGHYLRWLFVSTAGYYPIIFICMEETPGAKSNVFTKKFDWISRHPIIATISILVVIGIIGSGWSGSASAPASGLVSNTQATPMPVDPAVLAADKSRLAELKTKFNYTYDEFEKKGWYENKSQVVASTWNKKILRVRVNNSGYAYLEDQYYGDNWIFHTRVEMKIGSAIYKSDDIPSYDPNNATSNSGGSVWETISYTNDRDNGIIEAIAKSGDAPVLVRFAGDHGVFDFTLATRDRQAIKDSYELSTLIRELGDNVVSR
jgi:hypothetical protein